MSKKKAPIQEPTQAAPALPVVKAEAPKPTPAKVAEPAKPAPTKAAEPTPAPPVKPAAKAAPTAKPAPAKVAAPAKAKEEKPASKPKAAAKPAATAKTASAVVTVVIAKYDAGYGNSLHIRGHSAGLDWESGVLMKNVENDVWVWTTNEALSEAVEFKLLLNDQEWCAGENMSAPAGETTTVTPKF